MGCARRGRTRRPRSRTAAVAVVIALIGGVLSWAPGRAALAAGAPLSAAVEEATLSPTPPQTAAPEPEASPTPEPTPAPEEGTEPIAPGAVEPGEQGLLLYPAVAAHLDQVNQGDTLTIEVFGEVLVYRVIDTRVVEPTETESLLPVSEDDLVTLVTCTPLGVNSHRILVMGQRLIPTPRAEMDAAGDRAGLPGFPWWAVIGGGALLAAGAHVWLSGRPPRARAAGSPSAIG